MSIKQVCSCTVTKCKSDESSLYSVCVYYSVILYNSAHCLQCTFLGNSTLE